MKRRRTVLLLLGCVAVVSFAIFIRPREHEPEYNGVPLSEWVAHYHIDGYDSQTFEAIRHIGTNALPYLVRWIQYEKPRWKTALNLLGEKLPSSIQRLPLSRWLVHDKAERRAELATEAFRVLGPKARPARDELLRLAFAENSKSANVQRRATYSLMSIDQPMRPGDFDLF
jgi:hypothetical protein